MGNICLNRWKGAIVSQKRQKYRPSGLVERAHKRKMKIEGWQTHPQTNFCTPKQSHHSVLLFCYCWKCKHMSYMHICTFTSAFQQHMSPWRYISFSLVLISPMHATTMTLLHCIIGRRGNRRRFPVVKFRYCCHILTEIKPLRTEITVLCWFVFLISKATKH